MTELTVVQPQDVTAQPTSDGGIAIRATSPDGGETILALAAPQASALISDMLMTAVIAARHVGEPPPGAKFFHSAAIQSARPDAATPDEVGIGLTTDHLAVLLYLRFGAVAVPVPLAPASLGPIFQDMARVAAVLASAPNRTQ